jgi:CpeS-like protein
MDIQEFLQKSSGRWSSIKSNHHVNTTTQQSGKSTIEMELLDANHALIAQLCQKQDLNPTKVIQGSKIQWDGFLDGDTGSQKGSMLMAVISDDLQTGQIYRSIGNFGIAATVSTFSFADGKEFVLTTTNEKGTSVERIWFESDNVRLRHTKIHRPDGSSSIAFCSEVRLGVTKPAAEPANL